MKKWLITVVLFVVSVSTYAQCAMCRATMENSVSRGSSDMASNLNTGILYLFVMPYLATAVIIFLYLRARKKHEKKMRI